MTDLKKQEIKDILLQEWDKWELKQDLAKEIMMGYVYGPYAMDEVYNIDEYWAICEEINLELNPIKTPIEEEIV